MKNNTDLNNNHTLITTKIYKNAPKTQNLGAVKSIGFEVRSRKPKITTDYANYSL